MADGYARTTGRVGVCLMVPGPGVLNAGAGLATAYACSSPVLCLAGQIDSRAIDRGLGLLHEIHQQDAVLAAVTAWSACALSVAEIPGLVHDAFARLRSGRPRPVALELPADVGPGDYIEVGMLGAYGCAMRTQFNGFGIVDSAIVDRVRPAF